MIAPDNIGSVTLSSNPRSAKTRTSTKSQQGSGKKCKQEPKKKKNIPRASTTAPPTPTTPAVNIIPNPFELQTPSVKTFHSPPPYPTVFSAAPLPPQNQIVIKAPVTAAARNPARDFRGANGKNRMPGTWDGRGGVYRPQRRPSVEAVVSAHDNLPLEISDCRYKVKERKKKEREEGDSQQNGDHPNIPRIHAQHKNHPYQIPNHSVHLFPLTLPHQKTHTRFP